MNFYEWPDERAFRHGEKLKWENALAERLQVKAEPTGDAVDYIEFVDSVVNEINERGFAVLERGADTNKVLAVKTDMEALMDVGKHLWRGHNKPQSELRKNYPFTAIEQPLVNTPSVLDLVFHTPMYYDIATKYIGAPAGFSGVNLRKSFVNGLDETETQIYHVDPNSPRFLKMFFYLNDVDINGGPFQYVENSYKHKFANWQDPYRRTDQEVHTIYGVEKVHRLTANVGDVIIADTNAFHKGTKPISADRGMLTIDWSIHTEFFQNKVFNVHRNEIARINSEYEWTRGREYLWDFLIVKD